MYEYETASDIFIFYIFTVMDKTTEGGMLPSEVAQKVLDAVVFNHPDVVLAPFIHRAAIVLIAVAPQLFFRLMSKRAKKQSGDYTCISKKKE